jgi:FtsP/CotA-like multicopper oxidase with cupredoxin domain
MIRQRAVSRRDFCSALVPGSVLFGLPLKSLAQPPDQRDRGAILKLKSPKDERVVTLTRPSYVELTARDTINEIGRASVRHQSYNGELFGPTIRVRPGERIKIRLRNALSSLQKRSAGVHGQHSLSTTNLHTHGLHISPKYDSDNAFLALAPGDSMEYNIEIPLNHPPGTHWYHPHVHGSVAFQVANGMAGALIVEGGTDDAPEFSGISEKVLLIQQYVFRKSGSNIGEIIADDIYGVPNPNAALLTTINGAVTPEIAMRPGEIQRWRIIHAGIRETLHLSVEGHELHEIAIDGITLRQMRTPSYVELQPGGRVDVLMQSGRSPGAFLMKTEVKDAGRAIRQATVPATYIAKVLVAGEAVEMKLPDRDSLERYHPYQSITDEAVTVRRQITMRAEGVRFEMDGVAFDPRGRPLIVPVGSVEEWNITSLVDGHPFHVHVNPFEALEVGMPAPAIQRTWRDTVLVPHGKTVTIRLRFADFSGRTVMHCHILDHEDKGIMRIIDIVPQALVNDIPHHRH